MKALKKNVLILVVMSLFLLSVACTNTGNRDAEQTGEVQQMMKQPAEGSASILSNYREPGVIAKPSDFPWMPEIVLTKQPFGGYTADFNIESFAPPATPDKMTYYVDIHTGNDLNDGLTAATAFQSIHKGLQQPDVDILYIAPGLYPKNKGFNRVSPTRDIVIKPTYKGKVISSAHVELDLTLDAAYTHVYRATSHAGIEAVYDLGLRDEYGDGRKLSGTESPAEVAQTPGSWYSDGSTIWLRLEDDRTPDEDVRAYGGGINGLINNNITAYIEGIEFHGGSPFVVTNQTASDDIRVYFKDCAFRYSSSAGSNGLSIRGASEVFLQNCIASRNHKDGFNYHVKNDIVPRVLEVNCIGRHNGIDGDKDSINNGSTQHDGGIIIRVNGLYYGNEGYNIADINGSKSWIIGSAAYGSTSILETRNADFMTDGEMWLDGCVSYGSGDDFIVRSGGSMHFKHVMSSNVFQNDTY
ncbi:hypothetical protein [Paenibacillus oceani]|uniref:Pectate lyase superfamily protein domain-containing protein n=1 Tax=Paenibacillus oceani TaxID=2772510 RepID=A0A927CDC2_9BACL|nr:hypothetical protein [Paenibacillus oceani]MBD2865978.1 hypothetical protein [Paenibacillus oceani]